MPYYIIAVWRYRVLDLKWKIIVFAWVDCSKNSPLVCCIYSCVIEAVVVTTLFVFVL